jgi:hypothetical protein
MVMICKIFVELWWWEQNWTLNISTFSTLIPNLTTLYLKKIVEHYHLQFIEFNILISFEHYTWQHFSLFILYVLICSLDMLQKWNVSLWLDFKSSLFSKIVSTSLNHTFVLWFLHLISPCWYSWSNYNIIEFTSTMNILPIQYIVSNNM